jgi:mono/diheme cytochrome c family protein
MLRKIVVFVTGALVLPILGLQFPIGAVEAAVQSGGEKKTVWSGIYTNEQAIGGEATYKEHCASCHSENLNGGANEAAPPLRGDKWMDSWREDKLGSLFNKIKTTMPRRSPKSLSEEETLALVAYIMKSNEFPAGEALTTGLLDNVWIERQDGPKPLPNYAMIQAVGCMVQEGDTRLLKMAAPSRIRTSEKVSAAELKAAESKPLGTLTFRLQNFSMLGAFNPEMHKDHKMLARGPWIKQGSSDRISVTELEMLAPSCDGQ